MNERTRYSEWLAGVRYFVYDKKLKTQVDLAREVGVDKVYLNAILRRPKSGAQKIPSKKELFFNQTNK